LGFPRPADTRAANLYSHRVTLDQTPERPTASTLWLTVAFNVSALLVASVLAGVVGRFDDLLWALWLPVASLALSAAAGMAALASPRTRRLSVGILGGAAASTVTYVVLLAILAVTYFLVPGGHELS
jgi:hypothetical protein